ncbi:hypothetical protein CHARACLAT_014624 [Characodon lateralis]|uniref:Uncharacterized protein n=1 Tax=Characodon lateralis TaxID=208331 RepID=A0ABU7D0N0_9TELE|nr:hypothetical protein [Characodon lateralis]
MNKTKHLNSVGKALLPFHEVPNGLPESLRDQPVVLLHALTKLLPGMRFCLCNGPGRSTRGLMVPVGRLRSPTSQPQLIGLLLQLHDIPYCLFSPPISGISTVTGTTDLTATATGGSIGNRGGEHSPLALYASNLPGIWSKLFRRWELNTLLAKGSCQTFPADPHYTFGPAKSVWLPPLPADPIHH